MKNKFSFLKNIDVALLSVFSFSIPLWQKASTILIILWFIVALRKLGRKNVNLHKQLLLLPALFLLYLISMVIFSPFDLGILERKVSLLVFPIIFGLSTFSRKELKNTYRIFIYGCLIALILCYIIAFYNSLFFQGYSLKFDSYLISSSGILKGGNYFFGDHFSIFHQSVYAALYLNIAIIGLLNLKLFKNVTNYILIAVFGVAVFQISNKANIIFLLVVFCISVFYKIKQIRLKWVSAFVIIMLGIGIITMHPRTNLMLKKVSSEGLKIDRESNDGYGIRLLVWDASLKLIASNYLFGVGPSNAYSELKKVYKEKRYVYPYRNRLNSHNQFFQIIIECGVLGVVLLLFQLWSLIKVDKKHQFFILSIVALFCLNFMLESVFNRYSGIMIYSFFYCFLICFKKTSFPKIRS